MSLFNCIRFSSEKDLSVTKALWTLAWIVGIVSASLAMRNVAYADDTICNGVVDVQRFENVEVPSGATCTLNGTRIEGNVKVYNNASLTANSVVIGGNIQAEGAASIIIHNNSMIDGDIQIKQGGSATIDQVQVGGNIQLESNRGTFQVTFNRVDGNIQVFQNAGSAVISDNTLQVKAICNARKILLRHLGSAIEQQVMKINAPALVVYLPCHPPLLLRPQRQRLPPVGMASVLAASTVGGLRTLK